MISDYVMQNRGWTSTELLNRTPVFARACDGGFSKGIIPQESKPRMVDSPRYEPDKTDRLRRHALGIVS